MPYKDKEKQREYQRNWYNKKFSNDDAKEKKRQSRKLWREANRQKIIEYNKNWLLTDKGQECLANNILSQKSIIKRNKELIKNIKENSACAVCGEDHFATLDFHHIDPNTKLFNIAKTTQSYTNTDKLISEINKCIILCANCHRKLHYNE